MDDSVMVISPSPKREPSYINISDDFQVQGDQLNMAVYLWYLVKSDLSSVRYCTVYIGVHWKSHFLQGTWTREPCLFGQAVVCSSMLGTPINYPLNKPINQSPNKQDNHWLAAGGLFIVQSSVLDPFHFDLDPDPDPASYPT